MITNVLEYLEASAAKYPDKTAFADLDSACTFEELRQRARRLGGTFPAWKSGTSIYGKKCGYHRGIHGGCLCRLLLCNA